MYKKELSQERENYMKKTVRGKYGQDDHYLKFRQAIWVRFRLLAYQTNLTLSLGSTISRRGYASGQRFPSSRCVSDASVYCGIVTLNDDLAAEGEQSDEEDDVQVGGVTQDYRCPLTLTILVEPLTSYVHTFPLHRHVGPDVRP